MLSHPSGLVSWKPLLTPSTAVGEHLQDAPLEPVLVLLESLFEGAELHPLRCSPVSGLLELPPECGCAPSSSSDLLLADVLPVRHGSESQKNSVGSWLGPCCCQGSQLEAAELRRKPSACDRRQKGKQLKVNRFSRGCSTQALAKTVKC